MSIGSRRVQSETLYHRDNARLYISYVMLIRATPLFHHQLATCTENVKFREVNLVPGSKRFHLLPGTLKVVPQKTAADQITHRTAHTHEIHMF